MADSMTKAIEDLIARRPPVDELAMMRRKKRRAPQVQCDANGCTATSPVTVDGELSAGWYASGGAPVVVLCPEHKGGCR